MIDKIIEQLQYTQEQYENAIKIRESRIAECKLEIAKYEHDLVEIKETITLLETILPLEKCAA